MLSQESLAEFLEIPRFRLQYLESGRGKNIDPNDLLKISGYFRISIDTLLKTDIGKLSKPQIDELEAGNDFYGTGTKLRVLAISVDKGNEENMEYVPVKARAGYSVGYNDPEYIASLPKFYLPNLPKGSTWRMFSIEGDSMLPIPDGSDVICRYILNWKSIKPKKLCVVILKGEQDFVFKQVTIHNESLLLESLNKMYKPFTVPLSEVLELWEFNRYQSSSIPELLVDMQSVATALNDLKLEVRQIGLRK